MGDDVDRGDFSRKDRAKPQGQDGGNNDSENIQRRPYQAGNRGPTKQPIATAGCTPSGSGMRSS
ncbi:hypothetical protein GCM10011507_16890 [Edaphobacter acidisoli]|uniref:Uncharacterized protein n=1 Tax=Edaphobacter acidisoli TaxID=2040573 RepID=A0A916W4Z7_9BACT|nr:hypothetical protein GCM10011507_16890 [Edaphobacter acidisoli]